MKPIVEESQWKNLTNDILALILNRLNTKSDLCRFRSICKSWRSFATPIQPHLIFPFNLPSLHPNSRPFSLSPTLIYIFSDNNLTNNVWLTKVSETGENNWALLNPLTKHKLYFSSSGAFNQRINLLAFQNLEVGRSYRVQLIKDHGDEGEDSFDFEEFRFSSSISLRKVVVRICGNFSVLGLYGYGQIAVWNSGDEKWKIIENGNKEKRNEFDDLICFDGRFYAVDRFGRLVTVDSVARELVEVVGTTEECKGQYTYLVESKFRLYLVNKVVNPMPTSYYDEEEEEWIVDKSSVGKPFGFNIFVLNEKEKCWERVASIGNNVFFVSRDVAFSVCAEDLGWSKGNFIYFEGLTGYDDEADMNFGLNAGVYTLEDKAISTFGSSVDRWTRIFWPPSSRFVQNEEYPECEMQEG